MRSCVFLFRRSAPLEEEGHPHAYPVRRDSEAPSWIGGRRPSTSTRSPASWAAGELAAGEMQQSPVGPMKGARPLTELEVRAMRVELRSIRDLTLFSVLLYTGARISEALALDVDQVARADGSIRRSILFFKRATKNRRESRAIDVHPQLAAELKRHLATGGASLPGPLFRSTARTRLSRTQAWRVLHVAAMGAGLDNQVSPHSLRYTFAQRLHDRGVSLPAIQELLGHADIRDTRSYIAVSAEELSRAVAGLPPLDDLP